MHTYKFHSLITSLPTITHSFLLSPRTLKFLNDYLSVGPPMYFVIKEGFNFSDFDEQNLICQVYGCNDDSMLQQVFLSSLVPDE